MFSNPLYKRQLALLLLGWFIICFFLFLQLTITEYFLPERSTVYQIIFIPLSRFIVGALLIAFLIIPTYEFLKQKVLYWRILGFIILGLVFSVLYTFFSVDIILELSEDKNSSSFFYSFVQEILIYQHHFATYYMMFLASLMSIDYLNDKIIAVEKREKLGEELSRTKLSVLSNQLQPHFLFNALNSISAIIDYKQDAAQDMIADLSHLLRTSLQIDYAVKISITEELKILHSYLEIEKRRFEHQLVIHKNVSEEAKNEMILPFTLQPLFENAIKHGFSVGVTSLTIELNIYLTKKKLMIEVVNNGTPLINSTAGIGLSNLHERLRNAYDDLYEFELYQNKNKVVNQIKINRL